MIENYRYKNCFYSLLAGILIISGCSSLRQNKTTAYRTQNEDSTLHGNSQPLMMPYNRVIHAAGSSFSFGNPQFENHSLDVAFLPGNKLMVVEDRYGIVLIDALTHAILDRFTFEDDKK